MKVVDEKKSMGDSGAAETCSHETTFLKFHCNFLQDHNEEHGFIAANGTSMENLGQKRIEFQARNDVKSQCKFVQLNQGGGSNTVMTKEHPEYE